MYKEECRSVVNPRGMRWQAHIIKLPQDLEPSKQVENENLLIDEESQGSFRKNPNQPYYFDHESTGHRAEEERVCTSFPSACTLQTLEPLCTSSLGKMCQSVLGQHCVNSTAYHCKDEETLYCQELYKNRFCQTVPRVKCSQVYVLTCYEQPSERCWSVVQEKCVQGYR